MIRIVIINGVGGVGKSTFVSMCKDAVMYNNKIDAVELSTVDYVKEVAAYCGWTGTKSEKDRMFLHKLKQALEEWANLPNLDVLKRLNEYQNSGEYKDKMLVVFVNIRESYNIMNFKTLCHDYGFYDVQTMMVTNDKKPTTEPQEIVDDIVNFEYDYIISNASTYDELQNKADMFMNMCQKGI